ncbi:MAG: group 1 truncated hemoglobin [Anaerolineae bacterium]|nr:group 1 truncated hemoglobin [Anaerolineae bacterium]
MTSASYATEKSLYDRIGGDDVARAVTEDIWNNHSKNPIVNNRFANSDPAYVKQKVFEIIAATTGGSVKYTGKDMLTTHAGMNINDMEFNAVVDDVLKAFDKHNIGKSERAEVLAILWSVKDQIVNPKLTTHALSPH